MVMVMVLIRYQGTLVVNFYDYESFTSEDAVRQQGGVVKIVPLCGRTPPQKREAIWMQSMLWNSPNKLDLSF